jgi:hypothetical protein
MRTKICMIKTEAIAAATVITSLPRLLSAAPGPATGRATAACRRGRAAIRYAQISIIHLMYNLYRAAVWSRIIDTTGDGGHSGRLP